MKKSIRLFALAFICASLFALSFEIKNNAIEIDTDIMSFESQFEFESYMESLIKNDVNKAKTELGVLEDVLNNNNVLKISDYFLKLDMASESVLALHSDNDGDYQDLILQNFNNTNILCFSFDQDVLSILLDENEGKNNLDHINCTGSSYDTDTDFASNSQASLFAKAEYKKWGIYYRLMLQANASSSYHSLYLDEWDITYTRNCQNNYSNYGEYEDGDTEDYGSFYWLIYNGTTPLSSFHVFGAFSSVGGSVDVTIEG